MSLRNAIYYHPIASHVHALLIARSSGAYSDNLDACRFAPAVPWLTGVAPIATNICICICSAVKRPASSRPLTTTSGAASEGLAAREEEEEGEPSAADEGGGEGLWLLLMLLLLHAGAAVGASTAADDGAFDGAAAVVAALLSSTASVAGASAPTAGAPALLLLFTCCATPLGGRPNSGLRLAPPLLLAFPLCRLDL